MSIVPQVIQNNKKISAAFLGAAFTCLLWRFKSAPLQQMLETINQQLTNPESFLRSNRKVFMCLALLALPMPRAALTEFLTETFYPALANFVSKNKKKTALALFIVILAGLYHLVRNGFAQRFITTQFTKRLPQIQGHFGKYLARQEYLERQTMIFDEAFEEFFSATAGAQREKLRENYEQLFHFEEQEQRLEDKKLTRQEEHALLNQRRNDVLVYTILALTTSRVAQFLQLLSRILYLKYHHELAQLLGEDVERAAEGQLFAEFAQELAIVNSRRCEVYIRQKLELELNHIDVFSRHGFDSFVELIEPLSSTLLQDLRSEILDATSERKNQVEQQQRYKAFDEEALKKFRESDFKPVSELEVAPIFLEEVAAGAKSLWQGTKRIFSPETDEYINSDDITAERVQRAIFNTFTETEDFNLELLINQFLTSENQFKESSPQKKRAADFLYLILEELVDIVNTNSSQLYFYYGAKFDLLKMENRLKLLSQKRSGNDKMLVANYLNFVYKLVEEEFLSTVASKNDQELYSHRVKQNLKLLAQIQNNTVNEESSTNVSENESVLLALKNSTNPSLPEEQKSQSTSSSNGDTETDELVLNLKILSELEAEHTLRESAKEFLKRVFFERDSDFELPTPQSNDKGAQGEGLGDASELMQLMAGNNMEDLNEDGFHELFATLGLK